MYSSLTRIKNSDIYSNFLTVRTSYNVTYRDHEGDTLMEKDMYIVLTLKQSEIHRNLTMMLN